MRKEHRGLYRNQKRQSKHDYRYAVNAEIPHTLGTKRINEASSLDSPNLSEKDVLVARECHGKSAAAGVRYGQTEIAENATLDERLAEQSIGSVSASQSCELLNGTRLQLQRNRQRKWTELFFDSQIIRKSARWPAPIVYSLSYMVLRVQSTNTSSQFLGR